MSELDAGSSVGDGVEQTADRIDQKRREALSRLAKYAAPTMLAVLMSEKAVARVS
jgi:hypothetical protein